MNKDTRDEGRFSMKIFSRKTLVLLAVVVSFVAVQAVSAAVVNGPDTIIGAISSMTGDGLVFDYATVNEEPEEDVHVYGMGPATYWVSQGVDFPKVDDEAEIEAYVVEGKYVAASVTVDGETIVLRALVTTPDLKQHLIPLWSSGPQVPATETTVFSTTAADCTCDCECYCHGDGCDCTCDCLDCLEEQNQHRKGSSQ